jgi:hypothetical protein
MSAPCQCLVCQRDSDRRGWVCTRCGKAEPRNGFPFEEVSIKRLTGVEAPGHPWALLCRKCVPLCLVAVNTSPPANM